MRYALVAAAAAVAAAEPPQQQPADEANPEIVVEGKTREAVDRFVEALTQSRREHQIARWNDRICPRVLGLAPGQASYITNRIGAVARSLKIPVASGNCPGNIVIVVSDDADNFTRLLVKRHPRLFAERMDGLASRTELGRLVEPRPVRWIAASTTVNSYGMPINDGVNNIWKGSRLTMPTREDARLSFVIVDANRLDHLIWSQLADYLAMVTLARPAIDVRYDDDTILSVFRMRDEGTQGPTELTPMDRRLLKALYSTNPAVSAEAQRSSIRHSVAGEAASTGRR